MNFTVGGHVYDLTRERVELAMSGVPPETIQKHLVEMLGSVFPPKQVFAHATGRDRSTFTTQEAQRVLQRLGFVCREAGTAPDGARAWVAPSTDAAGVTAVDVDDRLRVLESSLATAQLAIAELGRRVTKLEGGLTS